MRPPGTISGLLRSWGDGDLQARDEVLPLVYQELRRRAVAYLRRERPDHTLQPTALVHETYLKLVGEERGAWKNSAQFFGVAAQMMRRILVDHARERHAAKRPSSALRVAFALDELDVHPDGARFALARASDLESGTRPDHVMLIFDFFDELRRISPSRK